MNRAEYISLRDTSKSGYFRRLNMLRNEHGHRTIAGLSRERIIAGILQPYADRPAAALDTLKKLRILIRHAINLGWLKHDPSLGIKRPKIQRIRSWTEDEINTFRVKWPVGSKQRLAFELFLNTGQRRSDVVRMLCSHMTPEGKITVSQQKTGRRLLIPLHRDLITTLEVAKRERASMRAATALASAIVRAARQLLTDLERGRRIDAAVLRGAMEAAFGTSDASGAWDWKIAYDACEVATVLFLRKYGSAIRAEAGSPAAMVLESLPEPEAYLS